MQIRFWYVPDGLVLMLAEPEVGVWGPAGRERFWGLVGEGRSGNPRPLGCPGVLLLPAALFLCRGAVLGPEIRLVPRIFRHYRPPMAQKERAHPFEWTLLFVPQLATAKRTTSELYRSRNILPSLKQNFHCRSPQSTKSLADCNPRRRDSSTEQKNTQSGGAWDQGCPTRLRIENSQGNSKPIWCFFPTEQESSQWVGDGTRGEVNGGLGIFFEIPEFAQRPGTRCVGRLCYAAKSPPGNLAGRMGKAWRHSSCRGVAMRGPVQSAATYREMPELAARGAGRPQTRRSTPLDGNVQVDLCAAPGRRHLSVSPPRLTAASIPDSVGLGDAVRTAGTRRKKMAGRIGRPNQTEARGVVKITPPWPCGDPAGRKSHPGRNCTGSAAFRLDLFRFRTGVSRALSSPEGQQPLRLSLSLRSIRSPGPPGFAALRKRLAAHVIRHRVTSTAQGAILVLILFGSVTRGKQDPPRSGTVHGAQCIIPALSSPRSRPRMIHRNETGPLCTGPDHQPFEAAFEWAIPRRNQGFEREEHFEAAFERQVFELARNGTTPSGCPGSLGSESAGAYVQRRPTVFLWVGYHHRKAPLSPPSRPCQVDPPAVSITENYFVILGEFMLTSFGTARKVLPENETCL